MNLISTGEVIELLNLETDVSILDFQKNKAYLSHAPIDVDSDDIKIDDNGFYLDIDTLIQFVSEEIFGSPVQPLFDANALLTHILL